MLSGIHLYDSKSLQNLLVKSIPYLASAIFGLILVHKIVNPYDPSLYGDAPVHFLFTPQILAEQVKNENILLWGSYNWNWYCGYPFLTVFVSLFYFLILPIKLFLNLSSTIIATIFYYSLYPLLTLFVYALSYEVTKDKLASIIGVLAYGCLPFTFTVATSDGTPHRLLALSFIPLFMFLIEKLINKPKLNVTCFVLAVLLLSTIQLAHTTIFFNLMALTVFFMALNYLFVRKFDLKCFFVPPISFILSSWKIIPSIYFTSNYGSFTSRQEIFALQESFKRFLQYFFNYEVGPIGLIVLTLSIVTYLISKKGRDKKHLIYLLCFIIPTTLLWTVGLVMHANVPDLRALVTPPFIVPTYSIFTIPPLASYIALTFSKKVKKKFLALTIFRKRGILQFSIDRGKILVLIMCFLLLTVFFIYAPPRYVQHASKPGVKATYEGAFEYVSDDSKHIKILSFSEYFKGDLLDWEEFGGSWSLANEICIGEWRYTAYLINKKSLFDFVYETSFKWTNGVPRSGIAFRFQDQNNTYVLRWLEKWKVLKLEKCVNGTWSSFAGYGVSAQVDRDTWHTLGVEVRGNNIHIYLDRKEVIHTTDETFSYGRIGFTVHNSRVEFDDLNVYQFEEGESWVRELFVAPIGNIPKLSPLYTQLSTPDGYYLQGCRSEIAIGINIIRDKFSSYKTDEALNIAKVFNVKYIYIAPKIWYWNYSRSPEIGQQVLEKLLNSTLADFAYQKEFIYVFKLNESYPMIASTNVFVITEGDEVSEFYRVVSSEFFRPSLGIFLSKDNDLKGIAWTAWSSNVTRDNGYVNLRVNNIEVKSMSMEFNVTVDRSCFLSLPISHYPFLRVEVDGQQTKALKSLPAFISLKVSSGTHNITVYRVRSQIENLSLSISICTFFGLIALPQIYKKTIILRRKSET